MMSDNGETPAGLPDKLPKVDPGKLKLRELAEAERQVGRRIAGELQSGDFGIDTMQALLWIVLRKHHPTMTFEQAGEYDMDTLEAAFEGDEEPGSGVDPTAASEPTPSAEPSSNSLQPSAISGG
jgi:hypothetical protein